MIFEMDPEDLLQPFSPPKDHVLKKWSILRNVSNELLEKVEIAKVAKFQSGYKDCAFLITSEDEVYVLGDNDGNLLTLGNVKSALKPTKATQLSNRKITEIVTGYSSGCALTAEGQVLTWGSYNVAYRMPVPHPGIPVKSSKHMTNNVNLIMGPLYGLRVVQVVMTKDCVLCLTSCDKIFGWGRNDQFISKFTSRKVASKTYLTSPVQIQLPKLKGLQKIREIFCADLAAYLLTTDKKVFAWGSNQHHLLGDGLESPENLCRVKFPEGTKIKTVNPSLLYTLAISETGDVYVWGDINVIKTPLEDRKSILPTKILFPEGPVYGIARSSSDWNNFVLQASEFVFVWEASSDKRSQLKNCRNIEDACAHLNFGMPKTWRKYEAVAAVCYEENSEDSISVRGSSSTSKPTAAYAAPTKLAETKTIAADGQAHVIGDNNKVDDHSRNKTLSYNSNNNNRTKYQINLQAPAPSVSAIGYYFSIPRNNLTKESSAFVGLENHLLEMEHSLTTIKENLEEYSCAVIVLHGMIGSGKTTLAEAFMRKKSTRQIYANSIVINAESMETIKTSFLKLIKVHNLETKVSDADQVDDIVQAAYKHLLQNPTLIVFDAAKQFNTAPSDADYNLTRLLPFHSVPMKPTIIVTTRKALTTKKTLNVRAIHIAPLSAEHSLELTQNLNSDFDKISTVDRKRLVEACGYNPLAIECCMEKISSLRHKVQPRDWDSAAILKSEKMAGITRELQEILQLPNGKSVSSIAIVRAAMDIDTFSADYLKQIHVNYYDITRNEFYQALELLKQFSIFDVCELPLVSMNRLMRVACLEFLYPRADICEDLAGKVSGYLHYVLVRIMSLNMTLQQIATWSDVVIMLASSVLFTSLPDGNPTKMKLVTEIMPELARFDAVRCWNFFQEHITSGLWTLINLNSATSILWCLLHISGWNNFSKKVASHLFSSEDKERENSLWYRLVKIDHLLTGKSHRVFAITMSFPQLDSESKSIVEVDSEYYLETLSFVGSPTFLLQKVSEMIKNQHYSLSTQTTFDSSIDVFTSRALLMQGKSIECMQFCSQRMSTVTSAQGENSFRSLESREQFATLLSDIGEFKEALEHIEILCSATLQLCGPTNIRFLRAAVLKANILRQQGSVDEAQKLLESTLETLKSRPDILHPDDDDVEVHPFVLYIHQCIGKHFHKLGLFPKALVVLQDAFDRQLNTLGSESFYTLESMYLVGLAQRDSGNIESSTGTFSQLMKFSTNVRDWERNAHVLKYAIGEAATLLKSGETVKAKESLEHIIKTSVEEKLWRHWCEAQVLLASIAEEAEAKKILTEVVEKSVNLMGPKHKNTLKYQLELVKTKWQEGNLEEGLTEIETVLKHMVPTYGDGNVSTLPWLNLKALVLCDLGKTDEALRVQKKVVDCSEKRLETSDHLEVCRYKYDLCLILSERGRDEEALELLHDLMKTDSKLMNSTSDCSGGPDEVELTTFLAYLNVKISPLAALVLSRLTFQSAVAKMSSNPKRCIQLIVNYGLIACALQRTGEAIQTVQYARSLYADQLNNLSTSLEAQLKVVVDAVDSMDSRSLKGAAPRVSIARLKFRRGGIIELRSRPLATPELSLPVPVSNDDIVSWVSDSD